VSISITPEHITKLAPNEVFVFGSNRGGNHGKGAALLAARKFGAIRGQGNGLMGQSYGISTKDQKLRVLSLHEIGVQVAAFLRVAIARPEFHFLVTQIGCGLAGYSPKQIAPLFGPAAAIPSNVSLPASFIPYLK
jgi:hypothetical protein